MEEILGSIIHGIVHGFLVIARLFLEVIDFEPVWQLIEMLVRGIYKGVLGILRLLGFNKHPDQSDTSDRTYSAE